MNRTAVAAGIILRDGLVLIAQRPPDKKLAGLWEFPGGKIEPGEEPFQALRRELTEELMIQTQLIKELGVYSHIYDWGGIDLHVMVVKTLNEPKPTQDVQDFKWVSPKEIREEDLAPADIAPLRDFLKDLKLRK